MELEHVGSNATDAPQIVTTSSSEKLDPSRSTNHSENVVPALSAEEPAAESHQPIYRVYKRRWLGMVAIFLLNIIGGMNWLWFAPVSIDAADHFGVSLTKINWLINIVNLLYLPISFLVPMVDAKYGLHVACYIGSGFMLVSVWVRYAGTASSLSPGSAYALLFIGQVLTGLGQPWFQILAPKYSEVWFDLKGRTTATAIMAIGNPVGSALGELISPLIKNINTSILILAVTTTAILPITFGIQARPPTPPTYAGGKPNTPFLESLRYWFGLSTKNGVKMGFRQRCDLAIITLLFGTLVAAANATFILVNQIFAPQGYSNDAAGNLAALILSGLLFSMLAAPLLDRVLTHHMALFARILVPFLGIGWLSLIWDIRSHNLPGLYAVFVVIGIGSFILLPIGQELACEVSGSAESSSAVLWCSVNLFSFIFVIVMNALRAGPDANPPQNMTKATIFVGIVVCISCTSVFGLYGRQQRRELDVEKKNEVDALVAV